MSTKLSHQVAEGFRLSPQQQRIWRLYETHPFSEFGCQCTVLIAGSLDVSRLDKAISHVASQHEIMRTSFAAIEGTSIPVQVVNESATGLDQVALLRCENETQRQMKIERSSYSSWSRLRDLGQAPPFRFVLATVSACEHVLVITASGLCSDFPTLVNLVRLIQSAYWQRDAAESDVLQYADISEWQNQLLESSDQDHSPYWKSAEFSELAFPRLPFQLKCTRESSGFTPEMILTAVPMETTAVLCDLASHWQISLQALLFGAWQVLLHRFSGMHRFLVGVGFDGRVQPELRSSLGLFTRFLPLAACIDDNPQLEKLLQQVNTSLEVAHCDQLLFDFEPFGIQDPSQRRRLFPVLFAYQEQPTLEMAQSFTWEIKSIDQRLEPSELGLTAIRIGDSLQMEFTWEPSVFAQCDIKLLADAYLGLLGEIAKAPERRIGDFTMISSNDTKSVLAVPAVHEQPWKAIHEIIEGHAHRVPNQQAVVYEEDQITYGELDWRASSLALRLEQAGVSSDSVVALLAERSIDFIVGILAVLKAGAAWMPIEPETPVARIQYMIDQVAAVALLTQRGLTVNLTDTSLPVVYLDEYTQAPTAIQPQTRRQVHPSQRAYVIFTSGSTGQPKGVAIEHRQIASYVRGLANKVNLGACANFAVVSTLAADLGHTAVFGALTSGGCLHVISASRALNSDALSQYFLRHEVDFVKIVPSHLESLCRSFPESVKLPWRYLLVGGELLTWPLVEMVQQVAPHCMVFNHYGPTETTVGVFCGPAEPERQRFQGIGVPIGYPFAGASAYLLDEQCRPVPVWISGELYVGGDSVGRGYVGRGDLTAERFIPDPFHSEPGARMYRTGDLARFRSDGTMEFLGRRDGQIKIRGYRVELGEIESAFCRYPGVQKAAVVIAEDRSTGKHLVAWVEVAKVTPDDLQRFVERSLPAYMVPKVIACVEHLKLTSNGKIDRQALLSAQTPTSVEFSAPADELEESLVSVWRSVLGVERIGVNDNYFSLGGDSLRVIQLVHEARGYGILITATDILRHPTIRQLRREMETRSRQALFPDGIPALDPPSLKDFSPAILSDVSDSYPVSGIQSFVLKHYRQGVFHIQDCFHVTDTTFSYQALESAFQAVTNRHPALRTVFNLQSDVPMQRVLANVRCNMNLEDISHLERSAQEDHIAVALRVDRQELFDPSDYRTPLFRVTVFQRSTNEFNLLFSCHHAIMDGWGHRVLLNQLLQAYESFKCGVTPDLGQPDNTCREFVVFQEAVRRSEKAAAFWRKYLGGLNPLSLTSSAVPDAGLEDASLLCPITPELTERLQRAARESAVSMQALSLSAWFEILRELPGEQPVVVGVVVNGRSEYLSDPLSAVGLFWNIVPLVSRKVLVLPAHAADVQKDLVEIEPYSAYPITQLLADQDGRELFFSTFRYLNFWNTQQVPQKSDLRLLGVLSRDRYSFPLNCSVVIDPDGKGGYLQLDYDPAFFKCDYARAILDRYQALLKKIASAQAA